ncbi:hypothetical protein [Aquamicrobium sp. LC103]|uniref:hypothetical protein n=1 Tax=Aquamicrobium sp. LC103 TaxID=1120658 RepID=UPI00063EC729|nr:hypothetical protein [Aquamicrobium sp. LC103]TKT74881.1 hypothetical protein XW59_020585 [Aquamicrobium sp. LC103]
MIRPEEHRIIVETAGESSGHCDCCGMESRCVWGAAHEGDATLAVYWVHWTPGHLDESGADIDLVLGRWGDEATADERFAVALLHRRQPDGNSALMVVDAAGRPPVEGDIARTALAREDVIGTPLAALIFSITDAIYEQDGRLF